MILFFLLSVAGAPVGTLRWKSVKRAPRILVYILE